MSIVEDTRNKLGKHELKHKYWDEEGTVWLRSALPYGDYWPTPKIAIDTKQDIQEIAMNLCGAVKEKRRFLDECKKARDAGSKLIFLIEDGRFQTPEDLYGKKIFIHNGQILPGDQVALAMRMHEERYGVEFWFCEPGEAGRVIKDSLDE